MNDQGCRRAAIKEMLKCPDLMQSQSQQWCDYIESE